MRGGELAQLRSLLAVVEKRSFGRAAAAVGLSAPALSQSIRALEERLGVQLFRRTTRSVTPTDAGLRLAERMGPLLAEMAAAEREAAGEAGAVRGVVRLNVPRIAALRWVAPWMGRFAREYPDVVLDVTVDDALRDIVAGRFDVGIRLGQHLAPGMVALPLQGKLTLAAVGSPEYFEAHGEPRVPADLARHRCIAFRLPTHGNLVRWQFERRGRTIEVATTNAVVVDDTELALRAAADGVGIAYLSRDEVLADVAAGKLRSVLDSWCRTLPGMHLYYARHRHPSPALQAFLDMVRSDLADGRRAPRAVAGR